MRGINKPTLLINVLYSEWALFVFVLGMMTIGYSRGLVGIANSLGIVLVATWGMEFLIMRRPKAARLGKPLMIAPILGFLILGVIMVVAILFYPLAYPRAVTYAQVCVLMIVAFNLIRVTGRTWPIDIGMFLGVLIMSTVASGDIMEAARSGTRYRLSVGEDTHGLNPNLYGGLLNLQILFFLRYYFIVFPNIRRDKIALGVLLLGGVATLVASYQILAILGSRQNQVWLFISISGILLMWGRGRIQLGTILPAGFVVGVIGLGSILLIKGSAYFDRFVRLYYELTTGMAEEASGYSRLMMIRIGFDLWLGSPIWGYGNEGFRLHSGLEQYSHNQYIELLVNYGLLGFLAFYSVHLLIIRRALLLWNTRDLYLRVNAIWFVVLLAGVMCSNLFQPTHYQKSFGLVLAAVVGLAYIPLGRRV